MRVIVGLSGGVDSSVAAYLLKKQGYDVIGVTIRTWESGGSRCCEIDGARLTAKLLDIPYHVINCTHEFYEKIELPFIKNYLQGFTPNPCISCNPLIKWEWMLYAAGIHQADAVATGHYARLNHGRNGRISVRQAEDKTKDQSYMLSRLTQEQLSKTLFPLGELKKDEVRKLAAQAGLPSASAGESQDVCFVSEGTYTDFILSKTKGYIPQPGNFVDEEGRILGRHKGIIHYTVGQRKGLNLALGYPVYVKEIRSDTDEIVISGKEGINRSEIFCRDVLYQSIPDLCAGSIIPAKVKVRYHHEGNEAMIEAGFDHTARIRFAEPARAPAPGQTAVFYDEDNCVIGSGFIA